MTDRAAQDTVTAVLDEAVKAGAFPGCVAVVWCDGEVRYRRAFGTMASDPRVPGADRPATLHTIYDLASLTKVLCTTALVAGAVGEGKVTLDAPVPSRFEPGCPGATMGDLLEHCSGLVAHREYFTEVARFDADAVLARVAATPPGYPLRAQAIYSDLGYMILGTWLESIYGASLDVLFETRIARSLGLSTIGYRPLPPSEPVDDRIAPTEVYLRDVHEGEVPSHFDVRCDVPFARGAVHDDNAFVMGGVAGHAGLFGTADDVLTIARAWLDARLPGLTPGLRDRFFSPSTVPGSTRRLGFDGPSPDGTGTAGRAMSAAAVGHTGYTGTSVWIDPDGRRGPMIAVLLSNRVHPVRTNDRIKALRPRFHEAAVEV